MDTLAKVARHFGRLVLLLAVLGGGLLTILGTSGGGGDDSSTPTGGGGWVTIDQPTSAGQYSTDRTGVTLGGEAFISPTHFRCCSGSATDTGVTVGWQNQATGASGSAFQSVGICWFFGFFLCDHRWTASVPLALGNNPITVTASDPSGNTGSAAITVTREPDTTPPTVTGTTPKDNALGVATNTAIVAIFSEEMEAGSINTASFFVVDNTGVPVSGAVSSSGSTATFTPSSSLFPSTHYTATVTTGVRDVAGNLLATQKSWSFTTGINTWRSMATAGGPGARTDHTAIWTGTEMIVWGGNATQFSTTPLNSGSRYRPATDSWQSVSTINAPSARISHTAVWTGTEMIIWGGWDGTAYLNTGGRYNPATNTWQTMSTMNAPSERSSHTAVWTGTEMIAWGGGDGGSVFTDGGRYDPVTDAWRPVTPLDFAFARRGHTTVWTGSRMIIWGGWNGTTVVNTGAAYDPASDTWQLLSTSDAPPARVGHTAVWTGTEMIVWGGWDFALPFPSYFADGGQYDPLTNRWQSLSATGAPGGRVGHRAVWTGSEMLVWGGTTGDPLSPTYLNTGGRYAPGGDSWQPLSTADAPAARAAHTAAWTGTEMIIWGGSDGSAILGSGGRYTP